MSKDEALRFALEALENITSVSICEATHHAKKDRHLLCEECPNEVRHLKAITAIKAALEAKDEPVAWANMRDDGVTPVMLSISQHPEDRANWMNPVPLYATPPQQEAKDEPVQDSVNLHQALTDPENQPNQYGVEFGMRGEKMMFKVNAQQFALDYEPDTQDEFIFMRDMLIHAFSTFTSCVKITPPQRTRVGLTDKDWNRSKHTEDFEKGVDWAEAMLKGKNT